MYAQVEKPKENKGRSVANSVAQKKNGGKQGFGFVDNRSEAKKNAQLKTMVGNRSAQQHQTIQKKENNTGLPDNLKSGIENLSGYSMDDVKVHYNFDKPAQLQAHAYAWGTDIHLGSGQEKHLPHEALHVVQQKQGHVNPTVQMKGNVNINDDVGLEKEADVIGGMALNTVQSKKINVAIENTLNDSNLVMSQRKPYGVSQTVVQRLSDFDLCMWEDAIKEKEALQQMLPVLWNHMSTEGFDSISPESSGYDEAKKEIQRLGNQLLAQEDIDTVYDAIAYYFPDEYLSKEDIAKAKKYNFDGPIFFTTENYISWQRLAHGQGTVDDLRYIHHEIFEIKHIEKGPHASKIVSKDLEEDSFWKGGYDPGHNAALMVEIRFLMEAVNRIYKKNYTLLNVICSDKERGEEFEAILPEETSKEEHVDVELGELLTQLKGKKLGSGKVVNLKADQSRSLAPHPLKQRSGKIWSTVQLKRSQETVPKELSMHLDNGDGQEKLSDSDKNHSAKQQHPIQKKEYTTGLPGNLKSGIENLSGYSMDDVKVHYNSNKPAQLQAHAYAQGTDIHIASGQEKHLPHEASHVVQQKQGRVKPTVQMKGKVNINDDVGLEKEADVLGVKAQQINDAVQKKDQPMNRLSDPKQDVVQAVFVYSYLGDQILENDQTKSYYEKLNFQEIKANGLSVMSDPRNIARARFLLKVMSYQELDEEVPVASRQSRPSLGGHDAKGIQGLVSNIIETYPPNKFIYLSPGASGDMISMAIEGMANIPVYRLALSDIGFGDVEILRSDKVKYERFKAYMYKSVGGLLSSNADVVIIDAVDKGFSLLTLSNMIHMLDKENDFHRNVEMMSLNVTKSSLKEQGINEIQHKDANQNFVKYRIYWQQYKEKVPRIMAKTSIEYILDGTITAPPDPNIEAIAMQSEEINAMIMGLWIGQNVVGEKERTVRALMVQLNLSRASAIEMYDGNGEGDDVDYDYDFSDDFF